MSYQHYIMLFSFAHRVARFLNFTQKNRVKQGRGDGKSKKNTQDSEPLGDGKKNPRREHFIKTGEIDLRLPLQELD